MYVPLFHTLIRIIVFLNIKINETWNDKCLDLKLKKSLIATIEFIRNS